jgi:hypothetical protein
VDSFVNNPIVKADYLQVHSGIPGDLVPVIELACIVRLLFVYFFETHPGLLCGIEPGSV